MQLLTVDQLAKKLSVSVRHVWRLHADIQLPGAIYLGRSVRWRESDIDKWIANGCNYTTDVSEQSV